jgi:hypothetical protein
MARRQLLAEDERRSLFGVPTNRDDLARRYTLTRSDQDLIATRRGDQNRLGFAVQLALLRHPSIALALVDEEIGDLVDWMSVQLGIPATLFAEYARRPQTLTDHARELATTLGLRTSTRADLSLMIEAGAAAAWSTDKGFPIAAGIVDALRRAGIMLPAPAVVERTGIAGRARARKRAADALLDGLTGEQLAALDNLLVVNPSSGLTTVAWLKTIPGAPKADHVRDLVDKLRAVRAIGIDRSVGGRIHESHLRQLVREGHGLPAYLLDRYTVHRRRVTLVALLIDLARTNERSIFVA